MRLVILLALAANAIPLIPHVPGPASILGNWYTVMLEIDETCNDMDTWEKVMTAFLKIKLSVHVCPLLRYTSPVPIINAPLAFVLGWMSFDWDPDGNNCNEPEGEHLCAWLKMYLVILDFIIPLMVLKAIWTSYEDLRILIYHATISILKEVKMLTEESFAKIRVLKSKHASTR
jgi:hypothetical protein